MRLYCFSEQRAAKGARHRRALRQTLRGRTLPALRGAVQTPDPETTRQGLAAHRRLKEKSRGIAQHYDIELDTDERGERATAVRFTRRALPGLDDDPPGRVLPAQQRNRLDEATLWRTYFTLTDLEAVFRSLKSELGLRPIYHHKPIRADGHLFITVIAYQLVQVGPHGAASGRRACELDYVTAHPRRPAAHHRHLPPRRRAHPHVRKATRAEPPQQAIYDALGIGPTPGGTRKTLV